MTRWEYARLEYRSTGSLGNDRYLDWSAVFNTPTGIHQWGTDERFNDLPHLNKAGSAGWQCYDRAPQYIGQPQRMHRVTYSFRRQVD